MIVKAAAGGGGRGTRSVASYDEDTTSLAVEAARAALRGDGDGVSEEQLAALLDGFRPRGQYRGLYPAWLLHHAGAEPAAPRTGAWVPRPVGEAAGVQG